MAVMSESQIALKIIDRECLFHSPRGLQKSLKQEIGSRLKR